MHLERQFVNKSTEGYIITSFLEQKQLPKTVEIPNEDEVI